MPFGFAEEQALPQSDGGTSQGADQKQSVQESHAHSKSKSRKPKEREAEGTQAPNRFEQDLIIKSRYEHNGQSLEVDTD